MSTPSPTPDANRNHLPNLNEVLNRRTLAPVDLFSFYIYMRDQQRSVDYLDFWLDVHQHMSLCRHYVRELRRSVLIETPDLEKGASKRSSAVLDRAEYNNGFQNSDSDREVTALPGPSNYNDKPGPEGRNQDHTVSAFLRQDSSSKHSASNSNASNTTAQDSSPHAPRPGFANNGSSNHYSPATGDSTSPGAASSSHQSPQTTVTRHDIRRSAEKILYTYLLPGSEREVILPTGIINEVVHAIEDQGRDDPEVFDAAQDYVFQAMERDAFPGFLKSKALGNLVPPSMMLRLIVGLLAMFGGLWTAFILIFLDYSRATRCWLILPFTIGVYSLATHQYMLDPILGFLNLSEYTFFSFHRVKEPFVRKLLMKRSITTLAVIVIITVVLCCLFILVPSTRL